MSMIGRYAPIRDTTKHRPEQITAAAPEASPQSSVGSTDGMDALEQAVESAISEWHRDPLSAEFETDMILLEVRLDALRRQRGSASIDGDQAAAPGAERGQNQKGK